MAFSRIIWGHGWPDAPAGEVDYPLERAPDDPFEPELSLLPTLFMAEGRDQDRFARVGSLQALSQSRTTVRLRYQYDLAVMPISQDRLQGVATELGLSSHGRGSSRFDWTTTQWTVQEGDLYRTLFHLGTAPGNTPTVFAVTSPSRVDPRQASAMMPYSSGFTAVYDTISAAALSAGLRCNRADNIWEHHTIIQDVVSLIDRSRIVVCDLSGRNPNVFYETGIAHSLGREVILITQHADDVPFDLRHIRYITYLNNTQGLSDLQQKLTDRMQTILRA